MRPRKHLYYLLALMSLMALAAFMFLLKTHYYGPFKKTATGLSYQVVCQGAGKSPREGDMLLIDMCYKTEKGVVLFDTADHELPMVLPYSKENAASKDGSVGEAIGMLAEQGDNLIFRLGAEKIFGDALESMAAKYGLKKNENLLLYLHLQEIMTKEAHKEWETQQITMLQEKQQAKAEQQLKEDAQAIAHYLKENNIAVQTTASGLCYAIDTPGQGAQPKQGNKVKVNYTGRLVDGKVFDTSLADVAEQSGIYNPQKTYEPIDFQVGLGQVIQGWDEGIMCLRQGTKARLFIPSTLAYGSQSMGNGLIPANAILIFDLELVEVQA